MTETGPQAVSSTSALRRPASLLPIKREPDIANPELKLSTALKILIVEDNPDDVFFFKQAMKKASADFHLHTVSDGVQAVAYLKGEAAFNDRASHPFPDVLLLDLNMPGMNGFELLEWVRSSSHSSHLIVHVMSASSRDLDIQKAYELGANSYVIKPSRIDELIRFVAALDQWHKFIALPPPSGQFH